MTAPSRFDVMRRNRRAAQQRAQRASEEYAYWREQTKDMFGLDSVTFEEAMDEIDKSAARAMERARPRPGRRPWWWRIFRRVVCR